MFNRVKVKAILRTEASNKRGEMPLCLQVFINGKRDVIPLSINIAEKYFDKDSRMVKHTHEQALAFNSTIATAIQRASVIKAEADLKKIALNKSVFRSMFSSVNADFDFVPFWEKELEKRLDKREISEGAYRAQKATFQKFKEFRKSVLIASIDLQLLLDYEAFLVKVKKNDVNTVGTAMKTLRTYINRLINLYDIDMKNPFRKYKIKSAQTHRQYLTISEIMLLHDLYIQNEIAPHLRTTIMFYMIAVFTSYRISDIKRLKEIAKSALVAGEIEITPVKTRRFNKVVKVPLSDPARFYLTELVAFSEKMKTDQKMNEDLKLIAAYAGIKKSISFHTSRHTFATTFLQLGGTVEVLQDILGHSRIATTMIYVHIVDDSRNKQIQNFNKIPLKYGTI